MIILPLPLRTKMLTGNLSKCMYRLIFNKMLHIVQKQLSASRIEDVSALVHRHDSFFFFLVMRVLVCFVSYDTKQTRTRMTKKKKNEVCCTSTTDVEDDLLNTY